MDEEEKSPWQYKPDNGSVPDAGAEHPPDEAKAPRRPARTVAWEAPEFISHPHGPGWYAVLVLVTAALTALIYFAAHDITASAIIILVGIIVGIFAAQKPGQAKYQISDEGLSINGKLYGYGNYKSFAIIREGSLTSINLLPLKRLMPPLSAYFEPSQEQKIVEAIGDYLPYENRKLDGVERLARRLRL